MKKRLYYIILLELLIVLVLTTAWEFWLEDFTFGVLNIEHAEEGLTERLEYIITSSVFVCIALVIPLWIIVMLPMCANCKNIRDDDGYWQQVEVYIRQHSKAEFSHSICPECAHQLYPDLFNQVKT
jgi:hypothetical protein